MKRKSDDASSIVALFDSIGLSFAEHTSNAIEYSRARVGIPGCGLSPTPVFTLRKLLDRTNSGWSMS
jgi:hypothetical protein